MASSKQLRLAKHLSLSLDFATKTAAILAQRRKGKTYTASVIAEEMVAAKQPFVALDPTGAWWGLRAGADGKREGLPVVVLGGQHGDVPLERTGGRLIADLVVEEPGYYVIDFSLFESGEAERQFAVDFAERLYRAKGHAGKDFPLHLFVDEADRFIPPDRGERLPPEATRSKGPMSSDPLRRLIDKWRGFASEPIQLPPGTTAETALTWFNGRNRAYTACADELEAAVRAPTPDYWRCKTCGCLWSDNHDGTVSLASAKETSCQTCEMEPSHIACEPLFMASSRSAPAAADDRKDP